MKPSRHLIIAAFFSFILFSSFTKIVPDQRLIDYLGAEKVANIQESSPDLIAYYNFYLDNAYTLADVPSDKLTDNNFPTLDLPLRNGKVDTKKLNILMLDIQRKYDVSVYYKINGSSQVMIFLSEIEFVKKYNVYRKQIGLAK
ncbi:MAG: hypothetical protein KAG64_02555 [Bacteroidales bacterium]|nr:hypothetical protein [Bacteroidales bacterium]